MSSFDRVVELINQKNTPPYPLTDQNIAMQNVTVDPEAHWNTRVTIAAAPDHGYLGTVDVFYTRSPLSALGANIDLVQEAPFTVQNIVDDINTQKTSQLTIDDFDQLTVPTMTTLTPALMQISAAVNSLGWLGNTQVTLVSGMPATQPALHSFLNIDLPAMYASYP